MKKIILMAGVSLLMLSGCSKVDQVKEGKLQINTSTTIGKVFDVSFGATEWTEGTGEKGQDFVEFKGDVDEPFLRLVSAAILEDVSNNGISSMVGCTGPEFVSKALSVLLQNSSLGTAVNGIIENAEWTAMQNNGQTVVQVKGKINPKFFPLLANQINEKDNGTLTLVGKCTDSEFSSKLLSKMYAYLTSFGSAEDEYNSAAMIAERLAAKDASFMLEFSIDEKTSNFVLSNYGFVSEEWKNCSTKQIVSSDDFLDFVCESTPNESDCKGKFFGGASVLGFGGFVSDQELASILLLPVTEILKQKSKRLTTQFIFLDENDADFQMGYFGLEGADWNNCQINQYLSLDDFIEFVYSNHSYQK